MEKKISTAGIVKKDRNYLVCKRLPGGALSEKWEFPGGKVDPGEVPEEALERELLEELGVKASVGNLICESGFEHKGVPFRLLAFTVTLQTENFELKEHQDMKWCTLEEIGELDFAPSDIPILEFLKENNNG